MKPVDLEANKVTSKIYVANEHDDLVSVIDGISGSPTIHTVIKTILVGDQPVDISINENTNIISVLNKADNNYTLIDGTTDTVIS